MTDTKNSDSSPVVVNFKDVCFAYEQREVLHNINMQVRERDMVAIVGPNGGGKSTLIKLALGIIKPIRGSIELFGKSINGQVKRTGYVPQHLEYDSAFPVNVLDIVLMGRAERHFCGRYDKRDILAAHQALEEVELIELVDRSFNQLSGGEKQRVLIAQALASQPEIIFLDEPTANVDSVVEGKIYDLLGKLRERITIIVVSHNLNVVTKYASHVACVNHVLSFMDISKMPHDILHSAAHDNMMLLKHSVPCPILDPEEKLRTSHNSEILRKGK